MLDSTAHSSGRYTILVAGDINVDLVIVPESENTCRVFRRSGGAWLLGHIIDAACKANLDIPDRPFQHQVFPTEAHVRNFLQQGNICGTKPEPDDPVVLRESYAVLRPVPKVAGDDRAGQVFRLRVVPGWRVERDESTARELQRQTLMNLLSQLRKHAIGPVNLTVLFDRNRGFREQDPTEFAWLLSPQQLEPPFILLQMNSPLVEGGLWTAIEKSCCDRTVVVVSATCLRIAKANLSFSTCAERVIADFRKARKTNETLRRLCECRHVVVCFDDGAVHWNSATKDVTSIWAESFSLRHRSERNGDMVGYSTIMVSAIAKNIARERGLKGVVRGIEEGVVLSERHYQRGFAAGDFATSRDEDIQPYERLFKDLADEERAWRSYTQQKRDHEQKATDGHHQVQVPERPRFLDGFALVNLPSPAKRQQEEGWNRFKEFLHTEELTALQVGIQVVQNGLAEVFGDIKKTGESLFVWPILAAVNRFGDFETLDRREIEQLMVLENLLTRYLRDREWTQPLSVAVFGPPGSGKSFSVKEVLKAVDPDAARKMLEINVAQCKTLRDLEVAFHQTQDRALSSRSQEKDVPYVFFDEFDCEFEHQPLGFLKYFLAPMQDGKFKEGESSYSLGKAVFFFAGGTAHSFDNFCTKATPESVFRAAKGPDFVSRLRGHLNVTGPNRAPGEGREDMVLRRATLLRGFLKKYKPSAINKATGHADIDSAVIQAFLLVGRYKHGTRSMEAIIQMSKLFWGETSFQSSSLPQVDQLDMHVDAKEFLRLLKKDVPDFPNEEIRWWDPTRVTSRKNKSRTQ